MLRHILLLLPCLLLSVNTFAQDPTTIPASKISNTTVKEFSTASWITAPASLYPSGGPAPVFSKTITLTKRAVKATLNITAHGLYEATLNGKKIADSYFTPGYTAYNKRLQYQQYDVLNLLSQENHLQITVADGWYRGQFGNDKKGKGGNRNNYGTDASLLLELKLQYTDGSVQTIITDKTWKVMSGAIRMSDLYDGETYDANFISEEAKDVTISDFSKDNLVPTIGRPVRKHEEFSTLKVIGDSIIDFGQNLAGWVKFSVQGKKGDTIKIYHAEALENGKFFTGNLRSAKATDTYILKGEGTETFEPHFTYHGFRYIKVSGTRIIPENYKAIALYTDLKNTGSFSCSNPKLNQLQSNILWSMKSNFFDIPTDCPQRSERLGWTEDADVFCPTACYLMDVKDFYSKWLADLSAEQNASGCVPPTVPSMWGDNTMGIAGWSDAATFTPWTIYQRYGDTTVLSRQYVSMKAWVDYVRNITTGYLWKANGFGDWYPAGSETDIGYLGQCYWYRSTWIVLETAKLLGHSADVKKYTILLGEIKKAFEQTYLHQIPDTQTAYVVGIAFGLLHADHAVKLAKLVRDNNHHLATGFMGTPYLLGVLSENGYTDLAYQLLLQEGIPSWLYMVNKGATTMWEKWDAVRPDGSIQSMSLNHYAFGSIGHWLYENITGIRPASPGYRSIKIQPELGGGLSWAKGSYQSAFGKIVSEWKVSGKQVTMKVEIPAGTTAMVYVPGETSPVSVKAGKYTFKGKV